MRGWTFMLGGMIVWTVHFFALYGIASVFLTSTLSRVLTVVVSVGCEAANAWLFVRARAMKSIDEPEEWIRRLTLLGIALSALAVFWQALPAVIG